MGSLNIEAKVKFAENLIREKNQARLEIVEKLEEAKFERHEILLQMYYLQWKYGLNHSYYERNSNQYLREAQDEHNDVDRIELAVKIKSLVHKLENGRNSLAQERQILKEIKCAQEQKEKLCADVQEIIWPSVPWYLQKEVKSNESIKNHMELQLNEMRRLRKQRVESEQLKKGLKVAEKKISSLHGELESINGEKGKLYTYILEIKKSVKYNI